MKRIRILLAGFLAALVLPCSLAEEKAVKVEGWVLDSSCAFTKSLEKPISAACARKCARGGSPLVLLTSEATVYWPISGTIPARNENQRLMRFAGQRVVVEGKVYERSGSKAMVMEKIRAAEAGK